MAQWYSLEDIFIYIIILLVLFALIKIYINSDSYNLKCVVSGIDGDTYCVRDRAHLHDAADLLASVVNKCKELVTYCGHKYPDNEDVQRLVQKFNPQKISETLPNSEHTAYSENKGEKIAFCLNKTKAEESRLIDINTLTFVALHELAHVMTKTEGHTQEFWGHFKFLLIQAKDAGIYEPVDYKKKPEEYCGMTITDNPYYDKK